MSKQYAGLKRVGYADTKAATIAAIGDTVTVTWLVGRPTTDSTINPEAITTEVTDGNVSGGGTITPEIHLPNRSSFAALETLGEADTEKYWYAEYFDGRVYVTNVPTNIQVIDSMSTNRADGADTIVVNMLKHDIVTNVFRFLPAS